MRKYFALMRLSIQSLLTNTVNSSSRAAKRKKNGKLKKAGRISPALGAALLIAFLGLYISGVYSMMFLSVLGPMHMEILLFIFMGMGTLMMGVLYTAFAVKNTVYGGEDNDLLLSMPVSTITLMLSRVTGIYVESLLVTFFMLIPAGVVYTWNWGAGISLKTAFWIRLLVVVFCLPFLDTAISLLIGAVLAWISTKFSGKSYGHTLITGIFLAGVFWLSFHLNEMLSRLAANADKVKNALAVIKPLIWMGNGIMESWTDLLRFVLVCVIPFILVVIVLGLLYKKAVTAFSAKKARSDYKLRRQHASGAVRALLWKETDRFFGNATYFWNAAMGLVMMAAAGVFLVIKKDTILPYIEMLENRQMIVLILMGFYGALLSLSLIAAPSVSLEGKNLWLIREAPVTTKTLLGIKTGFELLVTAPFLLVSLVCVGLTGILSASELLPVIVFIVLFEIGHACFGMLIGLRFGRLDEPNESYIIKRSLLSFLAVFAPAAFLAAAAILGVVLGSNIQGWSIVRTIFLAWMILSALFALLSSLLLVLKGEKLLARLGE